MAVWTHLFSSASEGMDWLLAADARLKESWSMLAWEKEAPLGGEAPTAAA